MVSNPCTPRDLAGVDQVPETNMLLVNPKNNPSPNRGLWMSLLVVPHYPIWLVVWNIFYFSIYWEYGNNHPNWLIFFRGVETTNQTIITLWHCSNDTAGVCSISRPHGSWTVWSWTCVEPPKSQLVAVDFPPTDGLVPRIWGKLREPHGFSRLFYDGSWFPASIPSNPGSKVTSSDTRSRIQCVSEEQRSGLNGGWFTIVDRVFTIFKHQTCGDILDIFIFEGSLEVKLPTIWTDEKQSRAEAERRERLEERRSEKRKSKRTEDTDARKGRKVAKHCVFPMISGSGGSKSRLAKAAGAEPAGQRRDEKLHAVVARSTFPSENVQNTPFSDHFWKWRRRKSARRCGAKHISKSKCTKHLSVGPLLEVEMSKKCTPLWREAHFQVKMYKTPQLRTTFGSCDVEKVHAVVARSTFPSQNEQNTRGSDHFWRLRCRKSARRCGAKHIFKSKVLKTDGLGPLLEVQMSKKCTPLWREAHLEVKSVKKVRVLSLFWRADVEKVDTD